MKVLLVKMSSMGDVLHTLPAVSEAAAAIPHLAIHWVVEPDYAALVQHHPAVQRVIPAALRQWRKQPMHTLCSGTWRQFKQQLTQESYQVVIDAQGLLKSAFITRLARGEKWGFDGPSAREPLSSRVLHHKVAVPWEQHAIYRYRQLFARALGYELQRPVPTYGLQVAPKEPSASPKILLCHGTTWPNKHWPEAHWRELAQRLDAQGWQLFLPHGNEAELQRAKRIAHGLAGATILPSMGLTELFEHMVTQYHGFVAGDTGLAHLAAAAGLPGIMIFGPTDPEYSGIPVGSVVNMGSAHHCAPCMQRTCQYSPQEGAVWPPCMASLTAAKVQKQLETLIATNISKKERQ